MSTDVAPNGASNNNSFSGVEQSLIGLSPQYWAYTPMLIGDIHRLGLVNGMDCIISPLIGTASISSSNRQETTRTRKRNSNEALDAPSTDPAKYPFGYHHLVPVSRCEVHGIIVNAVRRSNGSVHYVLDDGTGLIDCVVWKEDSLYTVPHLTETAYHCSQFFEVGDTVRVLGKLKCIYVDETRRRCLSVRTVDGKKWEMRSCVREINVMFIEHNCRSGNRDGDDTRMRGRQTPAAAEIIHWLKCVQFGRRIELGNFDLEQENTNNASKSLGLHVLSEKNDDGKDDKNDYDCCDNQQIQSVKRKRQHCISSSHNASTHDDDGDDDGEYVRINKQGRKPVLNGANILQLLGQGMTSQISSGHIAMANCKYDSTWKLFGPDCKCQLPFKYSLLYCHCLATTERLDPFYKFRDALLVKLLQLERDIVASPPSDGNAKTSFVVSGTCLQFLYSDLFHDKELRGIASETVSDTPHPKLNLTRLYMNTFRSLRNDGIIHLLDESNDIYMLISKDQVLVPYLRTVSDMNISALEMDIRKSNPPPYLERIQSIKLRIIMKMIASERRAKSDETSNSALYARK